MNNNDTLLPILYSSALHRSSFSILLLFSITRSHVSMSLTTTVLYELKQRPLQHCPAVTMYSSTTVQQLWHAAAAASAGEGEM